MKVSLSLPTLTFEEFMAALIDAIDVKRKTLFEFENTPFYCLEAEVNTPPLVAARPWSA